MKDPYQESDNLDYGDEVAHTPGPWEFDVVKRGQRSIWGRHTPGHLPPIVCKMIDGTDDDAYLIAAAPETAAKLAEAEAERDALREVNAELKNALAEITLLAEKVKAPMLGLPTAILKARAAIARATGQKEGSEK